MRHCRALRRPVPEPQSQTQQQRRIYDVDEEESRQHTRAAMFGAMVVMMSVCVYPRETICA